MCVYWKILFFFNVIAGKHEKSQAMSGGYHAHFANVENAAWLHTMVV